MQSNVDAKRISAGIPGVFGFRSSARQRETHTAK
jgi:hypothetical protein